MSAPRHRLGKWVRCRECKEEMAEVDLRDHWADKHGQKLKAIDQWLGKHEDVLRTYERLAKEGMTGTREHNES